MPESQDLAPPAPAGVDTEKPSAARVYDWYLGGTQNWAVDREFGRRAVALFPHIRPLCRQSRTMMNRIVRAALDAGCRQFLDLGSGVPTVGNVHEVVRDHLPEQERATVVYVVYEPVAAAHATVLLERDQAGEWAGFARADLRDVHTVLEHPTTLRLIDFTEPVCLLMIAIMHFIGNDDRPDEIVRKYREELAPGSWLAISHLTTENVPEARAEQVRRFVDSYRETSNPLWLRDSAAMRSWSGDWRVVEPGIVRCCDWRADGPPEPLDELVAPFGWVGVAEKGH